MHFETGLYFLLLKDFAQRGQLMQIHMIIILNYTAHIQILMSSTLCLRRFANTLKLLILVTLIGVIETFSSQIFHFFEFVMFLLFFLRENEMFLGHGSYDSSFNLAARFSIGLNR